MIENSFAARVSRRQMLRGSGVALALPWLASLAPRAARAQAAAQSSLQQEVQSELEAFGNAPGHEHLATVRQVMAGLIQTGAAQNLQDAYDRACWADPTVRAALQLAENTRRAAEQVKNRNAMLSVNGAPGADSTGSGVDPNNLRGLLEAQFNGGAGRV